jgi:hypothetical protein
MFSPNRGLSSGPPGGRTGAASIEFAKPRTSSSTTAPGICKTYTYEGLPDRTQIPVFDGISAAGWVAGISDAAGGTAQFINAPSGITVAVFLYGGTDAINFTAPVQSVQFYYATGFPTTVTAYDIDNNVLATETLPSNWDGNPNGYEDWTQIQPLQVTGNQISTVTIQSEATLKNFFGLDNLTVCGAFTIDSIEMTQAIQQFQTVQTLENELATTNEPPVPIIAGKPGVLRIYVNPPSELATVNMQVVIPAIGYSNNKQVTIMSGCSPQNQRLDQNGCTSTDFYFTPPTGNWTATVTVTDPNTGKVMDQHVLPFHSRTTNTLVVKGNSVCTWATPGPVWQDCSDASTVLSRMALLSLLAPTALVTPLTTSNVIRLEFSTLQIPATGLPQGFDYPTYYWQRVNLEMIKLYIQNDQESDAANATRTVYFGFYKPGSAPGCCGGLAYGIPSHAASGYTNIGYYPGVSANQWVVSHEVGHTLGLEHTAVLPPFHALAPGNTYGCFLLSGSNNPNWPFTTNNIQSTPTPPAAQNLEVGFNVRGQVALDPNKTFEQMGYCQPGWSSPLRYKTMVTTIGGGAVTTPSALPPTAPEPQVAAPKPHASATQSFWMVAGFISPSGSAAFDPIFEQTATGDISGGSGTYSLAVQNGAGATLFTQYVTPGEPTDLTAGLPAQPVPFAALVPVTAGAAQIVLEDPTGAVLGQVTMGGAAPVVAITSPTPSFNGTTPITWTISDPDSATFDSKVLYSPNNGTTWSQIGEVYNSITTLNADFTTLPGTNGQGLIKIMVSDGINTGTATSPKFSIPKKLPTLVSIVSPDPGTVQQAADVVQFNGVGYDPDDGTLSGNALAWSSSLQGSIGNGNSLSVNLQTGVHTITLTATDSDGNSISTSQTITITNQSPAITANLATLSSPPNTASTCTTLTFSAAPGPNGAPIASLLYSVDGGNTFTSVPLNQLPDTVYVPGTGLVSLVVEAIDAAGMSYGQSANYFNLYPCASLTVPNVLGQDQNTAANTIANAGLTPGNATSGASTTVTAGNVMGQTPLAGTGIPTGSSTTVNVVISNGPQVGVPNVVGQAQAAATTAIANAGLVAGTITNSSSAAVPFGEVISELPAAGTNVNAGTTIYLTVSTGTTLSIASPATLPIATAALPYVSAAFAATGGTPPYNWSATGLPQGMTIDANAGAIGGTPASNAGSPLNVTVTVTDNNSVTASKAFSLTIDPTLAISNPASLPAGTIGSSYTSPAFSAAGGTGSYTWYASGLAPGLKMGSATGVISGVPISTAGSYSLQVMVQDSSGVAVIGAYSLTINPGAGNLCDVNHDSSVNVGDVQYEINEALGGNSPGNDLNNDGAVTVTDVQIVINAVLNSVCAAF